MEKPALVPIVLFSLHLLFVFSARNLRITLSHTRATITTRHESACMHVVLRKKGEMAVLIRMSILVRVVSWHTLKSKDYGRYDEHCY